MKKLLLIILAAGLAISAFAQNDKKATAILDEVSVKTKAYKTIKIDFTMISLKEL